MKDLVDRSDRHSRRTFKPLLP